MNKRNWSHWRNVSLAMLLGLGIAACGGNDADESPMEGVPERVDETLEDAADRAEERHEEAMDALDEMDDEEDWE